MHGRKTATAEAADLRRGNRETRKPNARTALGESVFLRGDVLTAIERVDPRSCDLIISSPPYNIGKEYERENKFSFDEYLAWQDEVIAALVPKLKKSGSICWQVGNYIKDGESFPLDIFLYQSFKNRGLKLRNRIIWKFNFGLNSTARLGEELHNKYFS